MRVGVLGGSFDPIHHGHLIAARTLREQLKLDLVRLIPAGQQPFKHQRHGASGDDRAVMAELAVTGDACFAVERLEIEREGPSYTVDTLEALKARWPGAELTLLVGADAALEFPAWRGVDRIRALATVMVFTRAGAEHPRVGLPVAGIPQVQISSTDIRARVRAGLSIRYLVPDVVLDYIATRSLYL